MITNIKIYLLGVVSLTSTR